MTQTNGPAIIPKSCNVKDLQSKLLAWFRLHARVMPWRQTKDPYAIWLSETMLQQTQVATVTPYYHRFLQRFPTVEKLAAAELAEVLGMWAGLGYYRRAKHLHAAAQRIVTDFSGQVPATSAQLLTLPGVGRYTAAAVASIAFGEQIGVLDGNVKRVLARYFAIKMDFSRKINSALLEKIVDFLTPCANPGQFNESLMELGATVCTPSKPSCPDCPIRARCQARAKGIQEQLPVKKKSKVIPTLKRVAVVILREGRGEGGKGKAAEVLMMQRPAGVIWEHMWEFPAMAVGEAAWGMLEAGAGGAGSEKMGADSVGERVKMPKRSSGKPVAEINRLTHFADVLQEQLGIGVKLDQWLGRLGHQLTHRTMNYRVLRGFLVRAWRGVDPKLPQCESGRYVAFRWVRWPVGALQTGTWAGPMARVTVKIAATAGMTEPPADEGVGTTWVKIAATAGMTEPWQVATR